MIERDQLIQRSELKIVALVLLSWLLLLVGVVAAVMTLRELL
jgi:hypothetical protein